MERIVTECSFCERFGCKTDIKLNFSLYTHEAAPTNYCYGTMCYDICYRCKGCGDWCWCSYTYVQAYGSSAELECECTVSHNFTFGGGANCFQWEVSVHETDFSWTDSGISSGTTDECHVTCCASDLPSVYVYCSDSYWHCLCK